MSSPGLAADTPVVAAELAAPGSVISAADDAGWREIFRALAAQGAVRSTFMEQRWFAVRKQPVVLRGELRHDAERGLSLHYTEPEEQVMIVDRNGLLLRDARGRTRGLPVDPRNPRMDALLLPILRFDLEELLRFFTLHGARAGAEWRLDFVPRTPALARQLSTLTVFGVNAAVTRLEFRRAANQRVVVTIEKTDTGVDFTPEEEKRFFR